MVVMKAAAIRAVKALRWAIRMLRTAVLS
jgi:hypothetical protein